MDPDNTLAFDIETTGLRAPKDRVTVACVYGRLHGVPWSQSYRFYDPMTFESEKTRFIGDLCMAGGLCAFNGIRFDIPFLEKAWGLRSDLVGALLLKTYDIFELSKTILGKTFSLSKLLDHNNLENKSGTGLHAVTLAQEGRWDELCDYCMQDTRMTYLVSCMPNRMTLLPIPSVFTEYGTAVSAISPFSWQGGGAGGNIGEIKGEIKKSRRIVSWEWQDGANDHGDEHDDDTKHAASSSASAAAATTAPPHELDHGIYVDWKAPWLLAGCKAALG